MLSFTGLLRPFGFQTAECVLLHHFPTPSPTHNPKYYFLEITLKKKKSFSQAIEKATNSSLGMSSLQPTGHTAQPTLQAAPCSVTMAVDLPC